MARRGVCWHRTSLYPCNLRCWVTPGDHRTQLALLEVDKLAEFRVRAGVIHDGVHARIRLPLEDATLGPAAILEVPPHTEANHLVGIVHWAHKVRALGLPHTLHAQRDSPYQPWASRHSAAHSFSISGH